MGWVVAGVLLLSAGGAALAAQDATTTTQAPGANADKADKDRARAGALSRVVHVDLGERWVVTPGRRAILRRG